MLFLQEALWQVQVSLPHHQAIYKIKQLWNRVTFTAQDVSTVKIIITQKKEIPPSFHKTKNVSYTLSWYRKHFPDFFLRNRKHSLCFYWVIEIWADVWENEKCHGNNRFPLRLLFGLLMQYSLPTLPPLGVLHDEPK